jgi:hypothetical protein
MYAYARRAFLTSFSIKLISLLDVDEALTKLSLTFSATPHDQ